MTKNILYISANGFPTSTADGRGAFSLEHANALISNGATVRLLDTGFDRFGQDEIGGIRIERLPGLRSLARKADIRGLAQYFRQIRDLRHGPHDAIIISFFYLKYLPLLLLLRRRGVTVLFIAHGGDVMPGGAIRGWFKRLMFDRADVVTPVSDFTATLLSCLIRRKDSDNRKIVTIYNGVDWRKLERTQCSRETRAQLGILPSDFVVLSICNLIPRKGIDILVHANLELINGGAELHHVIIGRGPQRDMLVELVTRAGRASRFHFIDSVEAADLANFYAMADIFAMISKTGWSDNQTEGFGVTYAEAMALGTPVLGGSGSGTTTPIKNGFNGWLVDPHAHDVVQQVADRVRCFMNDRGLCASMGQNALWFAQTFFDWSVNARETLAALERAKRGDHPS